MEEKQRKYQEIAEEIFEAHKHLPKFWWVRIHTKKDLKEKIRWSKLAIERFPQNPLFLYNYGCYLALNKEYAEAKRLVGLASSMQIKYLFIAYNDNDLNDDFWDFWYNTFGLCELKFEGTTG